MRISDWSSDVCSSDLRTTVAQRLAEGAARRAEWVNRIEAADFAEVQADEDLMRIVRQSGQTLFRDNCSVCHGIDARGGPGYPNLVAGAWLWGAIRRRLPRPCGSVSMQTIPKRGSARWRLSVVRSE